MSATTRANQTDVRAPSGRTVLIGASATTSGVGVMTLNNTYGGTISVAGGPTAYVFKIGRFKRLLSFLQNNSQGTNGSRTQKPVQSVATDPAAGTVTVTWDTTIANSTMVQLQFYVEK